MGAERLTRLATLAVLVALDGGLPRRRTSPSAVPPAAPTCDGREWVNDGDTLTLTERRRRFGSCRSTHPSSTTDCYGRPALRRSSTSRRRGRASPCSATALDDRDEHGRLLRYVFVGNVNVNVELVRGGAASPYFFRNERGRYADDLLDAADEARDARRGFWGACPGAELNTGLGSVTGPA